ncbi:hypothetical protein Pst134EA_026616 [Puccinia striiformis f. sp. tritici]|uniref:hypothetical protein n=1 Tax=Puccinia striiformis f. sp. tritici TaxID=168172 RepID=UPI0020088226|nr:hypothetical protein Pst134EA_026616 [Puccinia striiformis f. sp. tritici]KAH9449904.1 hypothetical protein Pst134EA_026616 [Puccinia striiformis f. sp. tritici]
MGPGLVSQLVPADSGEGDSTSYPHLLSILLPGETPEIRDSRIEKVSNNIKAMIGFFDLDPNRTLDIILDVFCYNVISHYPFFCSLLKQSHWMQTVVDSKPTANHEPILPADGSLPSEQGSRLIASLLGFKFTHYQQSDTSDSTPDELYLMTAVLIWHKIVKLRDILPHLSPDLHAIKQHESNWRQEVTTKALNAGPQNALSMAGALDTSGLMGSYSKVNATKTSEGASASASTKPKSLPNQKAGLLSALLSIGALHESIFLLSIPNHQYLAHQDPNISALLLRLIDVAVDPAYRKCGLSVQNSGQQSQSNRTRPKRRYAGGPTHQLIDAEVPKSILSARVIPRAASLGATSVKTEPVFFWPTWRDRTLRAQTSSEFLEFVWPLLRFVGPFGHMHMGVFHKVATLTAVAVQTPTNEVPVDPRWNHILRWFLLPALSMTPGCVAASNVIWKVLQSYSYEERYMMYGEWKDRIYQRIPELKVERVKADAETKRVLKTMTLDNLREKSRALAKLASSNPCIVFNAALNQVQTYDNLIACVIECLRYLNLFALDVLTYSIVEFLSNPDKDRSKSDGTNIAAWLQNLAKFVGNVFKRNLSLDPAIVLQYIANQLATGNAKDLIILRDMISKMAGVDVLQDLSANQVVALGGSKTLRAEAISPTSLAVKKPSFTKSSNRLMKALTDSGLTVPLLLLVTLQRQNAVLLADEGAHLKYLGVLADSCQQVLFQYIEFLRTQLTSRSISDYEKALPSMELMWDQYRNDPAIVFQVWRPVLSATVRPALKIGTDGEVVIDENLVSATLPTPADQSLEPVTQVENPPSTDVTMESCNELAHYPNSLLPTVTLAEKILPEQTRKLVGPHFFVTFWQLELYDIRMPDERYISETSRLNAMLSDLDRDYSTVMVSSAKELNRANRAKILEIRATLTKEMKIHIKHYELTRARLASEKTFWFPLSARSPFRAQLLEHIIQHCFNPRAKISPVDAAYTAQFIKTLHGLGTASFMTLKLLDRIFSSDVGPSIFPCSEFEASNYGRFLKDLLLLVKGWYDSESTFKKTGLGKDKKGNYLPGLRMKWVKSDNAAEGIAESDMLSYENLQKVVKKWTTIMSTVCREAIQSGEYMYIRNSIAVLKELDGLVPLFEDQATGLEASVTELLKHEKREDVRVLAYGYQSMLKRAAKHVIKVVLPHVTKPDTVIAPVAHTDVKPAPADVNLAPTASTKINPTTGSNPLTTPLPLPKPAIPTSLPDSRPLPSPAPTANRPAGLPERPPTTARHAPPGSRNEGDRKLPSVPSRPMNGNGPYRNGSDPERPPTTVDGSKSQFPSAPSVPSAEAAQREALARAAVQRSRKFAANNPTPSTLPSADPSQPKSTGQQKEEPARPTANNPAHLSDRPSVPSPQNRPAESATRPSNLTPTGPKATRSTNSPPRSSREEASMRPPALPSAPRADSLRRDNSLPNNPTAHQHLPSHPPSHVSTSATASPRPRDDLNKRTNDENASVRSRDERDSYDRRDERDHRRLRDDPPRTRHPSVESIRSIRSGRDKEKRTDRSDRSEKRKRSRSPSDRHRDHRERERDRDRERERERERERDRERDKEREKDRERDRDRDRKDREKDRDLRHREKEKEPVRDDRDKDRERDREKRSHRRDRDRDDRRHDKDREREHKPTNDSVADDGVKRRKVIPSELSVVGEESNQPSREKSEPRKEPEPNHPTKGDDRNPRDANTDHKSANLPFNGSIPSGPRALQPPPMSPRTMRTIPTGPAASFPPGHPEHPRSKHSSSSADAINTHNSQNGHPTRKSSGQDHARGIEDSYKPRDAAQSSHAPEKASRDNASSTGTPNKPSLPPNHRQSGDSWSPHLSLQGNNSKNMEPKKNLSIRGMAGMAANALQKANEDNARKDRRDSVEIPVPGNRVAPIDVDVAIPKKRDRDRDSTGANIATTPTSLLSRMDDGKVQYEDSASKRKKEEGYAREREGLERDGHSSRRTSMRETIKQEEPRQMGTPRSSNLANQGDDNKPSPQIDHDDRMARLGGRTSHNGGRAIVDRDRADRANDAGRRKERERGNSRERAKRHNTRR